jgi:putative effector of murein hydrolase
MTHIAAFVAGMFASVAVIVLTLAVRYRSNTSSNAQKGHRTHGVGQARVYRRSTRFGRLERIVGVQGWK